MKKYGFLSSITYGSDYRFLNIQTRILFEIMKMYERNGTVEIGQYQVHLK